MIHLSFYPHIQYLIGHIFNHIRTIRNANALKFIRSHESFMAWDHEKKFHFYLAVKGEKTEALWKHVEVPLTNSLFVVSGRGLVKASGGS